jgi:hypothetical protein
MNHALELRREGRSYREIADVVGLKDEKHAQRLLSRAVKTVLKETAEEVRSLELSRLEILIKTLWADAIKDIKDNDYRKLDRVKGLIEAKLKWCGAVAAIDDGAKQGVTIVINKFTAASNDPALPPPLKTITSIPPAMDMETSGYTEDEPEEAELA